MSSMITREARCLATNPPVSPWAREHHLRRVVPDEDATRAPEQVGLLTGHAV
jgi:hypothetical protein